MTPRIDARFNLKKGDTVLVAAEGVAFRVNSDLIAHYCPPLGAVIAQLEVEGSLYMDEDEDLVTANSIQDDDPDTKIPPGCMVINLNVPADVLAGFLTVIYQANHVWAMRPMGFEVIANVLRFSQYYDAGDFTAGALMRLRACYPMELEKWKVLGGADDPVKTAPLDAITAIQLAHLTDVKSILPGALYRCCIMDDAELSLGSWEDDTTQESYVHYRKNITLGRLALLRKADTIHVDALKQIHSSCASPNGCRTELLRLRNRFQPPKQLTMAYLDIITTLTNIHDSVKMRKNVTLTVGFCRLCTPSVQGDIIALQKTYWSELPKDLQINDIVEDWPQP